MSLVVVVLGAIFKDVLLASMVNKLKHPPFIRIENFLIPCNESFGDDIGALVRRMPIHDGGEDPMKMTV